MNLVGWFGCGRARAYREHYHNICNVISSSECLILCVCATELVEVLMSVLKSYLPTYLGTYVPFVSLSYLQQC